MPRTPRDSTTPTRRRLSAASSTGPVVGQIAQIVTANEQLHRQNRELREENEHLRGELLEIGSALRPRPAWCGTSGTHRRHARRQRRPITDPEVLARRAQALVKARAAMAERLVAARAAGEREMGESQ